MNNTPDSTSELPDPAEYWKPIIYRLMAMNLTHYHIEDPSLLDPNIWVVFHNQTSEVRPVRASALMKTVGLTNEDLELSAHSQERSRERAKAGIVLPLCEHMNKAIAMAQVSGASVLLKDAGQKNPEAILHDKWYEHREQLPLSKAGGKYLQPTPAPAHDDSSPTDNVI